MRTKEFTEQIVLHLRPDTRQAIERAATDEGRTLANLTRRVLERWAAERESGAVA